MIKKIQTTDSQRIKNIRKSLKLNQQQFAESLGLTQGGYSDIERGKNNISGKTKLSLKNVYSVNLHWLETGHGKMFALDIEEDIYENEILGNNSIENDQLDDLKNEIKNLRDENLRLKAENKLYTELCSAKDKAIKALESQIQEIKRND